MLCDCSGANCTITRACTVPNGGRPSSRAANSSRMPPSQPRAPPRSRALACGPRGDRRGATVTEGKLPLAATRSLTRLPRAARPPEAAISDAWARSWPAFLHDWHRVARADLVTLVLGAVWNPHAWRNAWLKALRGGACRNPGQGNSGGQDESDETHAPAHRTRSGSTMPMPPPGRGLPALRGAVSLRTGSPLYRTATQLRAHQSA